MKKTLCYLMLGCIMLSGCASNSSGINNTEESKEIPTFVFPEASNEDGTLYFTCQNWDSDIYLNESFVPKQYFYIISLEPLDMKEIKITVPIENAYSIRMTNIELEEMKMTTYMTDSVSDYNFPYHVYQCYRGTDWKKMRELHDAAEEAEKLYEENSITYEEMSQITKEYKNYRDLYLEDYEALTSEDLPTYYAYSCIIFFAQKTTEYDENGFMKESESVLLEEKVSESFQTIDIQIGDRTYTQEIGEVRLHAGFYPEHLKKNGRFDYIEVNEWPQGVSKIPFGDGIMQMAPMKFAATEDLTLTELYMYECNATALTANVVVSDAKGNMIVEMQWDLKSPIPIEKGQQVSVRPIIQDMNAIQLEYGSRCCPVLTYTVGEGTYYYMQEQMMDSIPNTHSGLWVRYAAVFDGLAEELKDYYTYYYPVFKYWREGLN